MKVFNVYDIDLNRVGEVSTFVSSIWREGYNQMGEFQLELQNRSGLLDLLKIGRYVGKIDKGTLMVIKSIQVYNNRIIVNGNTVTRVLADRSSVDVVNNENAEAAIRRVVSGMTAWPHLELGEAAGLPDVFPRQFSDGSVLEYCDEICTEIDAGYRIRHDRKSKKLLFELYKPTDNKNLIFAAKFGNLTDSNVSMTDTEFKNVAVVAGTGVGDTRVTVTVGAVDTVGADRREIYLDARHIQPEEGDTAETYLEKLKNYGLEQLAQHIKIQNVKISVAEEDFGKKYGLGDNIVCILEDFGLKLKVKIIGFTETIQRNGTNVEISVGNPILIKKGVR